MGWVETLPSGRFRALAWNAQTDTRELAPHPRHRTWDTWIEADAAWRRREREIDGTYRGMGVPVERNRRHVWFADYAHQWAKIQGGAQNTRLTRHYAVRRLCRQFGELQIDDITSTDVRAYFADLESAGFKPNTRARVLTVLRQLFQSAVRDHLRENNPAEGFTISKVTTTDVRIITDAELLSVLPYLPAWARAIPLLAYDCGLRVSEIGGLTWKRLDLDTDQPTVLVQDVIERDRSVRSFTKGKNAETLPLSERTAEALRVTRTINPGRPSELVFRRPERDYAGVTGRNITQMWQRARIKAGLDDPPVAFHHLRHAAATNLARAGAPAPVIQRALRHGDLTTSQRYIEKVSLDEQRSWMARVHQPIRPVRALRSSPEADEPDEHAG